MNCIRESPVQMFRRLLPVLLVVALCETTATNRAVAQIISGITPSSANAGSGGFVIAVSGSGFTSGSLVRLNRANGLQSLQTYFVNANLLLAGVSADDVASPGDLQINVANYAQHSTSNQVSLVVVGSGGSTPPPPPPPPPPPSGSGGGGCYGCVPGTPAPPPPPPPSGGGSSGGGSTTSPSGSNMLVTVTSPTLHESVVGKVTVTATATPTSKTDGGIVYWAVFDSGNLLWVDVHPDPSINVDLALSKGAHTLQVVAYDDSFTGSTATVPVTSSSAGNVVSWHACMYTQNGQQYQAMQFFPKQPVTGVLQSEMFYNSGCNPTQWTDQLNDVGQSMSFGTGFGYTFYFIHRPNLPGVSAVWTIGDQTSGCVNYNTAPACP